MAHGYLGDGYGMHGDFDSDRDDDRERNWRRREDWRDRDRERGMMFGRGDRARADEDRWSGRGSGREGYGREHGFGGFQGDYRGGREQGGFGGSGDYSQGRRSFSANRDDHYRSWRDRQMSELDRDYEDYCREREQQFHREFNDWRSQRHANHQPLQPGMTQTGMAHDPSGELQLTNETDTGQPGPDPLGEATLGTTTSERKRR